MKPWMTRISNWPWWGDWGRSMLIINTLVGINPVSLATFCLHSFWSHNSLIKHPLRNLFAWYLTRPRQLKGFCLWRHIEWPRMLLKCSGTMTFLLIKSRTCTSALRPCSPRCPSSSRTPIWWTLFCSKLRSSFQFQQEEINSLILELPQHLRLNLGMSNFPVFSVYLFCIRAGHGILERINTLWRETS